MSVTRTATSDLRILVQRMTGLPKEGPLGMVLERKGLTHIRNLDKIKVEDVSAWTYEDQSGIHNPLKFYERKKMQFFVHWVHMEVKEKFGGRLPNCVEWCRIDEQEFMDYVDKAPDDVREFISQAAWPSSATCHLSNLSGVR